MNTKLLSDIEQFMAETGMSEAGFGRLVGNGRIIERLRISETPKTKRPVRIWPDTEIKIRAAMMTHRQKLGVSA